MKTDHLKQFTDYIKNARNPTKEQFIQDWEPIGERVILHLYEAKLIYITGNRIYLA